MRHSGAAPAKLVRYIFELKIEKAIEITLSETSR